MDGHSRSPTPAALSFALPEVKPAAHVAGFKRARSIKASIENNTTALYSNKPIKKRVEDDPENQIIKTLRQHHQMEWTAIANYLNEERLKRGEPPTMTQPSVYSRFVRNAPRIAAANGEVGFDPKDYMYLRHPHHFVDSAAVDASGAMQMSKKRARSSDVEAKELQGNVRKRSKLAEECAELETVDKTTLLAEAVETIQRNFWTFVADELERTTGKLYDPKAIASRFGAI